MKRRNKSCLGVFVIGLFTVYIFIVYRWFFRESAGDKIQQDNLPTDSGMFEKKEEHSNRMLVNFRNVIYMMWITDLTNFGA